MPNSDATNAFAAALPLDSTIITDTVNPYGLAGSTSGEPQGVQAMIAPVLHNDTSQVPQGNDFNGDGSNDLLWRNYRTGENALWYLNEGQYSDSAQVMSVGDTNWEMVGTGDLNGDLQNDLVWRNKASGENVVWFLNNGQYQSSSNLAAVGDLNWQIESVNDFDGNGSADLIWRNRQTGSNIIWYMQGSQYSSSEYLPAVADPAWSLTGAGDANRDGSLDLFWRNGVTGENIVWYMQDRQYSSSGTLASVADLDWRIEGIEDFNNDSKVDLLWRNYRTGENVIWHLDNTTIQSDLRLATVADTDWRPVISGAKASSSVTSIPSETTTIPSETNNEKSFNIEFDYRFDTNGWFTAERRAALEAAAEVWEGIILDDFETTPVGTATPFVTNPQTGSFTGNNDIFITDVEIDDLVIFVGARTMANGTLGQGGASGYYRNEDRYVGDDFEPWLGSIAFSSNASWFFDATPSTSNDIPNNQNDFISTAIHEIGHVLGFSSSIEAFAAHLNSARDFAGPNAMARNGGAPIPLEGSHIEDGYEFEGSGEAVLDPISFTGARQLPTVLDIAIFDDIGYEVNYSQAAQNQAENRNSGISGDTGSNRMVAHDSSTPDCCSCQSCQSSSLQLALIGETSLEELIAG